MKKIVVFCFFWLSFTVYGEDVRLTPVVRAVQRALPSVVNIATEQVVRVSDPYEAFFRDFFQGSARYYRRLIPLGSGVIVDSRGLIVTNYHVVRRASNIDVRLFDGEAMQAHLVAYDRDNDLALLQLEAIPAGTQLQAIAFARPDDLMLGETVVAVGNPFGLGHSVTTGVLSAINRHFEEGEVEFDDILQTDAAINPGNSGGPLINLDGELIGLNLAIRRDAQGIGFAVPLARIETVVSQWLSPCRFSNGLLGLETRTQIEDGESFVAVAKVVQDSPAEASGLMAGEVLVAIDGRPVENALQAGREFWPLRVGEAVVLTLRDGREVTVSVAPMTREQLILRRLRLHVQTLTPPLRQAMGLPDGITGVAISEIEENSELSEFGIGRGDIIMALGGRRIGNLSDLAASLEEARAGDRVQLDLLVTRAVLGELLIRPASARVTLN